MGSISIMRQIAVSRVAQTDYMLMWSLNFVRIVQQGV